MISFRINNKSVQFDGDPDTPLLWALRDHFKLTGTKYGCGIGQCKSCTVHVDGKTRRSCRTRVSSLEGKSVVTIEGLTGDDDRLHPVQQAWLEEDVPQCGYCQTGLIMTTVEFLQDHPSPSDEDINTSINNLCRCGTYVRVRKAIHRAAELTAKVK
ncbi:MAG: (2Fe-2S)-binding protein [Gammaproteobacteria bacterium]|nr:(2Fe-2S)-binding protein [Gammaproteobacteria bacterium]